jgi:hypothetical protein
LPTIFWANYWTEKTARPSAFQVFSFSAFNIDTFPGSLSVFQNVRFLELSVIRLALFTCPG